MEAPSFVLDRLFTCALCRKVVKSIKDVRLRVPNTCSGKVRAHKLCKDCIEELKELIV